MLELPEVTVLARQINENVSGQRVAGVTVARSPPQICLVLGKLPKLRRIADRKKYRSSCGIRSHAGN